MLAVLDLAFITGTVYRDVNGNGFTPGEQLAGASVQLFRDVNGNGVLDAGDGAASATATTDANGDYRFSQLSAGDYFVKQPAQSVSGVALTGQTSVLIPISASDAQGVLGTPIDSFVTAQSVVGPFPVGTVANSSEEAPEVLGGERDLIGVMTAGTNVDRVTMTSGDGRLAFDSSFGAVGTYTIVWDGPDGNGAVLNPVGLGGVDLTAGGTSTHVRMNIDVDKPGGVAILRIYSEATGTALSDNFEDYDLNAWPPNWAGDGNSSTDRTNNRVVADPANPSNQVLKLYGVVGGTWGANAYRQYAFPESFTLETAVYNGAEPLSGGHPYRGCIELRQGTFWGNPERHLLIFDDHNNVTDANGRILQSYQTKRWYDVKIGYDRVGTDLTLHYWIDGVDRGVTQLTISDLAREQSLDHVNLTANEGTAYFDNLKITPASAADQDNWSQVQLNLADTAGQPDRDYLIDLQNDLQIGGGSGADITSVGAVVLEIVANTSAMDGQMTVIDTRGPSVFTADFPNVSVPPPDIVAVSLDPHSPRTNDVLTATVTRSGSGDPAIRLTYVWKVNGTVKQTRTLNAVLTDTFDLSVPGHGDRGDTIAVEVTPADGTGAGATVTDAATVTNSAPVLATIGAQAVAELTELTFEVSATDADVPSLLIYSAEGLPSGAAFDPATRQFRWTPTETQGPGSYEVIFAVSDDGTPHLTDSEAVTITVHEVNEPPSDIVATLSLPENQSAQTVVGLFAVLDRDVGDTHTFALVNGQGDQDNAEFTLGAGGRLVTAATFDYEAKNSCSIRVRATDRGGLWFEKAITVQVTDVNEAPTDMALSASSLQLAAAPSTVVGKLTTFDPDAGDAFTYTLVDGDGGRDNDLFTIDADGQVRTAASEGAVTSASYSLRVRTTDRGGLWCERVLTLRGFPAPVPPDPLPVPVDDFRPQPVPDPPQDPLPDVPDPGPVPDPRPLVFALFASGGQAAPADPTPEPSGSPAPSLDSPRSPAPMDVLLALGAPAETALLDLLATDLDSLPLIAFDLGDEVLPADGTQPEEKKPDPTPPEPDLNPLAPAASPSDTDLAGRLLWTCLPVLIVAAAGASWYWRKTWRTWLPRVRWRAGLLFFLACSAGMTWAAERADLAAVIADVRQCLARGDYRTAYDRLQPKVDHAERSELPVQQRLVLLGLLADVHFLSGAMDKAAEAQGGYHAILKSAADLSDTFRSRCLRESLVKLAEIQTKAALFDKAERIWRELLETGTRDKPDNPLETVRWRLKLAQTLEAGGDKTGAQARFAEAETELQRVLGDIRRGKVPHQYDGEAHLLLAECQEAGERWNDAAATLDRLLEQLGPGDPTRSATYCQLARYQHEAGHFAEEREALRQALRLVVASGQAESLETTLRSAEIWDRLGQAAQAEQDLPAVREAWDKAAEAYRRASSHAELQPAARGKLTALRNLREILVELGDEEQARKAAQELVDVLRVTRLTDDPEYFSAQNCLASLLVKARQYDDAVPYLDAAKTYWETHQPPQPLELALLRSTRGEMERESGSVAEAAKLFVQALEFYEQALPDRDPTLAVAAVNLGAVEAALGNYSRASERYEQALTISGQAPRSPRAAQVAHAARLNLAMVYKSQGQFDKALRCCDEAWEQRPAFDESAAEAFRYHRAKASLHLAKAEAALRAGKTAESLEDLKRAGQYAEQARSSAADPDGSSEFDGESAYLRGSILFRHGAILLRQGNRDDGLNAIEAAAADWTKALHAPQAVLQARVLTRLCEADLCLVDISRASGQLVPAVPKLVRLCEETTIESQEQAGRMTAADAAGSASAPPDVLQRAKANARRAIGLLRQSKAHPSLHFSALVNCAQAVRAQAVRAQAGSDGAVKSEALKKQSRDLLQEAVELLEGPRAMTTGAESERAQFFSRYAVAFDLLVDWCVQDQLPWEALRYAEASRNRTFLDQVRAAKIDLKKGLEGGPHQHLLDQSREALNHYARTRLRAADVSRDPTEARQLSLELENCQDRLWQLEKDIRNASPLYRDVLLQEDRSFGIQELQRLPGPGELVLVYHLGCRRSHLFLLSGGDRPPEVLPLRLDTDAAGTLSSPGRPLAEGPLTRDSLVDLIRQYLNLLLASRDPAAKARGLAAGTEISPKDGMTEAGARSLTNLLLPLSVRERLSQPQYARVVIVPDGALQQLPFEALMWPADKDKTTYVLDRSPPIVYAPSARILTVLRERDATAMAGSSLLTVGKTTFATAFPAVETESVAAERTARAGHQRQGGARSPLPAARRECTAVAEACRRAGFTEITSLLDTEATEGGVRRHCAGAGILHFATHAFVDQQRDNCFGGLELTPSGGQNMTPEDDGLLEVHEIHGLSLTACDLAVLSACETNVGPDLPLEAGSTLARAFFAAGARRVVCSLWEVPDDSTSRLIAAFFENLQQAWDSGQPADYAAALHQARQSLRREAERESPYYWAPFVLIGRPQMP